MSGQNFMAIHPESHAAILAKKRHTFPLAKLSTKQQTIKGLKTPFPQKIPLIHPLPWSTFLPAVTHPTELWAKQFICSVLLVLSLSHTPSVSAKSFNLSVALFFLNTHPPSVITQTVRLVPQPAAFQIGPFDKKPIATVSPLCSSWILTNPAAVPSILHPPSPPKLCRFVSTWTEGWRAGCHSLRTQ